jgi:uncharacterized zinc-type alcohol dehydrogenase-like protein
MSKNVKAYGAKSATADLEPMTIERRETKPTDVKIEISYCGVCHSDIHTVRNDWQNSVYPVIPGHEIIGRVVEVGKDVSNFKEGQLVGVENKVDEMN